LLIEMDGAIPAPSPRPWNEVNDCPRATFTESLLPRDADEPTEVESARLTACEPPSEVESATLVPWPEVEDENPPTESVVVVEAPALTT
jgi:hypothetical protein